MFAKDIFYSTQAREKMMSGINQSADAVKVTLGPKGRNVIIEKIYQAPRITKDGVTVIREINLNDRFENMGAQMLKQVAIKTSEIAGDGTTTATVLAQAMMIEGMKAVSMGMNPMDLKRGIDLAVDIVVADLIKHSTPISTAQEINQIATISANGDKEIGEILAEAFVQIGKDGIITFTEGKTIKTQLDIVEGIQFDHGYLDPAFTNQKDRMIVEYEKPLIFVHESRFTSCTKLMPVLDIAIKEKRPLIIICHDVSGDAIAKLILNHLNGAIQVCCVQAPSSGKDRKEILEDIMLMTGGKLLPIETGARLENAKINLDTFGTCEKIIITKDKTSIIEGEGDKEKIKKHCENLKQRLKDYQETSDYDEEQLKHLQTRIANFSGMAIIRVGGTTIVEIKERKDRVEDAMYATRAAIEEGILPGGGVSLIKALVALENVHDLNSDIEAGINIIKKALISPCRQIAENAGVNGDNIVTQVKAFDSYAYGYDAQKGFMCDLLEYGIIDPTKVVRIALEDAASIAGLLITTEAMIAASATLDQQAQTQTMAI